MGLFDFLTGGKTPERKYSELNPEMQSILNRQMDQPQSAISEANAEMPQIEKETSPLLQAQSFQAGPEGLRAAIQARQETAYQADLGRLKNQLTRQKFDTLSGTQESGFQKLKQHEAFNQARDQARYEYDLNRQRMRQNAINSLLGNAATIAGAVMGGPGGAMAARQAANQAAPQQELKFAEPLKDFSNYA